MKHKCRNENGKQFNENELERRISCRRLLLQLLVLGCYHRPSASTKQFLTRSDGKELERKGPVCIQMVQVKY